MHPNRRRLAFTSGLLTAALVVGAVGTSASGAGFTPGSSGAGDPYFPLDGNGGYDVSHYDLNLTYQPSTDVLSGTATIAAQSTQDLSSFNLDLTGMTVRSVTVDGRAAAFSRNGGEMTVTPRAGIRKGLRFKVAVTYDGVPESVGPEGPISGGFIPTDDGVLVAGQPHGAATWFPANDHPIDTASFTFNITVPEGLEAVANGELKGSSTRKGWTTWKWDAAAPMATYLATIDVGDFDLTARQQAGIKYWDAVDTDLLQPFASPRSGTQFLFSTQAQQWDPNDPFAAVKPDQRRLTRTIDVPATGDATLSFWMARDGGEFGGIYEQSFFVEAHHPGSTDWTMLPDMNGATDLIAPDVPCYPLDYLFTRTPWMAHYATVTFDEFGTGIDCRPTGTTGSAHVGQLNPSGWQQWRIDLSAYAGQSVEISLTSLVAGSQFNERAGTVVDDITVPGSAGSTSFEADGDVMDGWVLSGRPLYTEIPGTEANGFITTYEFGLDANGEWTLTEPNPIDWTVTTADGIPRVGRSVKEALGLQPQIIAFLSNMFGPYPFTAAGGIVDDRPGLGFALETQTRPVYAQEFFCTQCSFDANHPAHNVVAHELAHQWVGDSLPLSRWQDIWLNEGFATYAEWSWNEHEGGLSVDGWVDFWYKFMDWSVPIGDPGPDNLFGFQVYYRGAMTLHALRRLVGDATFFRILKTWTTTNAGKHVTTDDFIELAERLSHRDLDGFFHDWLYSTTQPAMPGAPATTVARAAAAQVASAGPATAADAQKIIDQFMRR